jgi:serine phosphatase RsbU (regulator of sigma subunit)
MESNHLRWASVGAAFALFAAVDLLVLLLTPAPERGMALLPPTLAGLVVLVTLPSLLNLLEKQQDRIERQRREIVTHHAMHTAIAAEMELPSLLAVAAHQATQALDAEQGGIVLGGDTGPAAAEAYFNTPEVQRAAFRALVRGSAAGEDDWEIARVALKRGDELLGRLAVAKRKPCAAFTAGDGALLEALAQTVVVAITNAGALEVERALARERRVTLALQEGLLPEVPERSGPLAFSKRYEAQSAEAQVGGDIYDLFPLGERRWGVMIADVSGKGLAAARKTAMVKYALRSYAREHMSPAAVLSRLNDALFDEPDISGFVTLVYGVLSEDGVFTYASAGHETPLLRRARGGGIEALSPTGVVLGAMRGLEYGEAVVTLHPGDGLLLYTDGLSEARSPAGEFLEVEGLSRILATRQGCPANRLADVLLAAVRAYAGGTLSDDAVVLWIERCDG